MELFSYIFLGIIQGLTEFLPVSSSGHLVLMQHFLQMTEDNLLFGTILHLGTACAILIVFRKDLQQIFTGLVSKDPIQRKDSWWYSLLIIIGTVPAGFVGVFFKDSLEHLFTNPNAAGVMLLATAGLLFFSATRKSSTRSLTLGIAFLIGVSQALAIIPGISRSGSTIATALLLGIARPEAGRFSFMLALPAILGAVVLHVKDISTMNLPVAALVAGFITSFITGYFALRLLLHFVDRGKLFYFGYYCVAIALLTIFFV
ncbi:MAG: undecaprenyl-diphosphate phosphatase [Chitinivibrionales bacterium]